VLKLVIPDQFKPESRMKVSLPEIEESKAEQLASCPLDKSFISEPEEKRPMISDQNCESKQESREAERQEKEKCTK